MFNCPNRGTVLTHFVILAGSHFWDVWVNLFGERERCWTSKWTLVTGFSHSSRVGRGDRRGGVCTILTYEVEYRVVNRTGIQQRLIWKHTMPANWVRKGIGRFFFIGECRVRGTT